MMSATTAMVAVSTSAAMVVTIAFAIAMVMIATATTASAAAFTANVTQHLLNFLVRCFAIFHYFALNSRSNPASGWFKSIFTVSSVTSNTRPVNRFPSSFCNGTMASL